ncbi:MAG: Coenzyme F420 hydrogenase/dehydrogenase, beta subunit C-terminal domain [Agathobacter sp.]|uniref:polysaccharide pyruvyl transferase family protein n=1 Tax=Agathobacter sp. TaxID=2021311 RepID=UPI00258FBE02|nr:polysaccharide pyruvyl transferase family protein [Agathobacter sp.]MCR5678133.1 Coenzyme F420 hydrogenase/dehydrogenase, beta subunit C-terminal domain [Agathobacter sp.]
MRIGILSLYKNGYNFGAQLQAYALCKALSKYGECEQISYEHQYTDLYYWLRDLKSAKKIEEFSKTIPHSARTYDNYTISDSVNEYDVFVTGSDQVWGDKVFIPYENTPIFTLSFVPDDKLKIAYAASTGGGKVDSKYETVLKDSLCKLDAIGVREKAIVPYIESLARKAVQQVCDPVFLIDRQEWEKVIVKPNVEEPYDVIYMIGADNKAAQYESLNRVIDISPDALNISPLEFLGYIRYAQNVISDSFHAIAFSVIFERNFCPIKKDEVLDGRIADLLAMLQVERPMVMRSEKLTDYLSVNVAYKGVHERICRVKEDAYTFIEQALAISKNEFVVSPHKCTGCGSCADACPQNCISWEVVERGFLYPRIDKENCIDCGKCKTACPVIKKQTAGEEKGQENRPLPVVFSAVNKDEKIVKKSSSGGVFYELADYILEKQGGHVYATCFGPDYQVTGCKVTDIKDLEKCMTSKYAQSDYRGLYKEIKSDLENDLAVLFVGTPCQCSALKSFLGRPYKNLLVVDFICHGVLSNELWKKYVAYLSKSGKIVDVCHRDKSSGVISDEGFYLPAMRIRYEDGAEISNVAFNDKYLQLFLENTLLRESCYHCLFRGTGRESDLTLGDFHGKPNYSPVDKDKEFGTSLVFVNSEKGKECWEFIREKFDCDQQPFHDAILYNYSYSDHFRRQDYTYYLGCVLNDQSFEKIYEEFETCDFRKSEKVFYKRNVTIEKSVQALSQIGDNTIACENLIIYGMGEVGRLLYEKLKQKPRCLIDGGTTEREYQGKKVLRPYDVEVEDYLKDATVVVTSSTEYLDIIDRMKNRYGNINIITINDFILEKNIIDNNGD